MNEQNEPSQWNAMIGGAGQSDAPDRNAEGASGEGWTGGDGDHAFAMEQPEGGGKRRLNEGLLLMVLVLSVAAGALFVMRKTGQANVTGGITDAEIKIEKALAQLTGDASGEQGAAARLEALLGDTEQVVAMFLNDPTGKQVSLGELSKNPFALDLPRAQSEASQASEEGNIQPAAAREEQQRQRRLRQIRGELAELELQSVMNGRTPMAMISNQVVRTGERLGSFTVAAIEPRTVVLTAEGNTYRLTMEQPNVGGATRFGPRRSD